MNSEPNSYLSQEAPQWMRDMFEGLFPDADKLNLEEMQQRLDELEQPPMAAAEQGFQRPLNSEGEHRQTM